jgi:excinuclease UvrABC nuclease subunit
MAISWTSSQLQRFEFDIFSIDASWNETAGLYMFCGQNLQRLWAPKYIGQASSFKERLCDHEQWAPAVANGATHVLAMVVSQQSERDRLEKILIAELHPPLNVQHRRPVGALSLAAARLAQLGIPK